MRKNKYFYYVKQNSPDLKYKVFSSNRKKNEFMRVGNYFENKFDADKYAEQLNTAINSVLKGKTLLFSVGDFIEETQELKYLITGINVLDESYEVKQWYNGKPSGQGFIRFNQQENYKLLYHRKFSAGDVVWNPNTGEVFGRILDVNPDGYYMETSMTLAGNNNLPLQTITRSYLKPRLEVGDVIEEKKGATAYIVVNKINPEGYYTCQEQSYDYIVLIKFGDEGKYKYTKGFDSLTMNPFDKVLYRMRNSGNEWVPGFLWKIVEDRGNLLFYVIGDDGNSSAVYDRECIPYNDDTKHLVNTSKETPKYYKTL